MNTTLEFNKFAEIVRLYEKLTEDEKYTLLQILSVINHNSSDTLCLDNIDYSYDKKFINALPDSIKSKYYEIEALSKLEMCCSDIRFKIRELIENNSGIFLDNTNTFVLLEKLRNTITSCDCGVFDCKIDCCLSDNNLSFTVSSTKINNHKSFTLFFSGDELIYQEQMF